MRLCLAILASIVTAISGFSRDPLPPPPPIDAVRSHTSITIDGILNEPVWRRVGYSALHQRVPIEDAEPSKKTEVWVAYDDDALYVAARMYDNAPDSIITRLTRRDGFADGDMFWFGVDPYHDKRTGYFFGISAAGAYNEGTYQNDEWTDDSWDGIWEGKARIDSLGWTAELRVPFSQLRFHNDDEQVWGFDVRRYIPRIRESDYITYAPANGSGHVSRFIELHGIRGIPSPSRVEVLPYATAKAEYLQHAPGDPFLTGARYTPGIGADIKMGIGPNLTLDGTVNPDFGQVEVDPAVLNLSDQETFFWEKRPFFLEGTQVFRFGIGGGNSFPNYAYFDPAFVFTRRIGRTPQGSLPSDYSFADVPTGTRILGAAKLTGKFHGDHSIGFVQAVTAREYADVASGDLRGSHEVEPLTSYTLARARKEFDGGKHSLGVIATGTVRSFDEDHLRNELPGSGVVGGIDGWTFLDDDLAWVLTGYVAATRLTGTPAAMIAAQSNSRHYFGRPDATHIHIDSNATSLNGYTARFWLNKQKGNLLFNAAFGVQTPGLDLNDAGLSFKDDVINGHAQVNYRWTEPGEIIRNASVGTTWFQSFDFAGNNIARGVAAYGSTEFTNYMHLYSNILWNFPALSNTATRGGPMMLFPANGYFGIYAGSDERLPYAISINPSIATNPHRPLSWSISSDFTWNVSNSLMLSVDPSYNVNYTDVQYVTTIADPYATATYAHRYVFAALDQRTLGASIRANWTFTPDLSLQCYIQPFITTGAYHDIKELARPGTYEFNVYGSGAGTIVRDGDMTIDPDGSGPAAPFTVSNPDFSYRSFRLNAVLRWEYLPGSTIYLVWTQNRIATTLTDGLDIGRDNRLLFSNAPDNVLLLKVSYWIQV